MTIAPKFLGDVGVGKAVEEWLRTQQYDVLAVRDLDPRMSDNDILLCRIGEIQHENLIGASEGGRCPKP